jgi:hypothetical protein
MKNYILDLARRMIVENREACRELFPLLEERAMVSSCEFIEENSDHLTKYFKNHWEMRASVFKEVLGSGLLLEFGVNRGRSANFFCKILDSANDTRNYYGFDTFTGLTEDWGGGRTGWNF